MKLSNNYNPVMRFLWGVWDHLPELIALAMVWGLAFGFVWIVNELINLVCGVGC